MFVTVRIVQSPRQISLRRSEETTEYLRLFAPLVAMIILTCSLLVKFIVC